MARQVSARDGLVRSDQVEHDAAVDIARSLARRLLKIRQIDSSHVFNSRRELISRKLNLSQRKNYLCYLWPALWLRFQELIQKQVTRPRRVGLGTRLHV